MKKNVFRLAALCVVILASLVSGGCAEHENGPNSDGPAMNATPHPKQSQIAMSAIA